MRRNFVIAAVALTTFVSRAHAQDIPLVDVDATGVEATKDDPKVDQSHPLAVAEVLALVVGLNLGSRAMGYEWAKVDGGTMKDNLEEGFVFDNDGYTTNQLAHPIGGVAMFTAARSLGHSFWVSGAYTFGGSLVYELLGENEPASIGDQITTPFVGMMLGEPLHRFARSMLYTGYGEPGSLRKVAASAVNPLYAINRAAWRDPWMKDVPPALYAHFGVGIGKQVDVVGEDAKDAQAHLELVAEHGLTGDSSFDPKRPFDHFEVRASFDAGKGDLDGTLYTRGLAWGRGFRSEHETIRGMGGVFAAYDFSNQELVRHSILGVGPGVTAEYALGERGYLQGSGAAYLVPWGAAGGANEAEGVDMNDVPLRDYHRGPGVAGMAEMRLGVRKLGELRAVARAYEIAGRLADDEANEQVFTSSVGARFQLADHHAIGVEGTYSYRRGLYEGDVMADTSDGVASVSAVYAITTDQIIHR